GAHGEPRPRFEAGLVRRPPGSAFRHLVGAPARGPAARGSAAARRGRGPGGRGARSAARKARMAAPPGPRATPRRQPRLTSLTLWGPERSRGTVLSERRPWHRSVRYPLARLAVAMLVLVSAPALAQGGSEPLEPQGRFEAFRIFAPQLGRDRDVIVYLPPGYDDDPAEHYPVAYFQDGQNVFDRRFFAGRWLDVPRERSWSADLAADARAAAGCPLIIVAIVSEASRAKDYVPFDIAANGFASNAPAYAAFLVETLKPHVDAAYRTRPEATATAA